MAMLRAMVLLPLGGDVLSAADPSPEFGWLAAKAVLAGPSD
jgi:hypothetical protein